MINTKQFLDYLRIKAEKVRMDAGYSGSHSDGGASDILQDISIYIAGQKNKLPKEWKKDYSEFMKTQDDEYDEYVRLNKKFDQYDY